MNKLNIIDKIKSNKKLRYLIVAILIVAIFLIVFLSVNKTEKNKSITNDVIENYVVNLENKLSETLKKVEGVGKVSVAISVESGMETVLAMKTTVKNTEDGTLTEETPILVNGKTVVLKELYPKISGVLIVAEGVENPSVLYRVQQATTSLLDIDVKSVEILTMK